MEGNDKQTIKRLIIHAWHGRAPSARPASPRASESQMARDPAPEPSAVESNIGNRSQGKARARMPELWGATGILQKMGGYDPFECDDTDPPPSS
jgi:hypothetical protein